MVNVYEDVRSEKGGAKLINVPPRALYHGEIYELFVTDEKDAAPGKAVSRFSILGHFEVKDAGLIRTGDVVSVDEKEVGKVAGYEPCRVLRAPNFDIIHIFMVNDRILTGKDLELKLGDKVVFTPIDKEFK
jgi:hypothetical protein